MVAGRSAGVLALVLASLLWGTTGTTATLLPDAASPLAIGAATMGIGGLLLAATAPRLTRGVLREPTARRAVLVGTIGVVVYPLAFYSGMALVGVAVGNVVALGSGPVFAALLERIIDRERLSTRWLASTGLAVVGIALLAAGRREGGAATDPGSALLGVGLALLAGFAYALFTWASSRAIRAGGASRGVMGAMFGVGALPLVAILLALGAPLLSDARSMALTAYLAIGPMWLAYVLFGIGLRSVRSSAATTITLLEPVVATLLAVVVVGERLEPLGWAGLAIVLAGIAVLLSARRPRAAAPTVLDSQP